VKRRKRPNRQNQASNKRPSRHEGMTRRPVAAMIVVPNKREAPILLALVVAAAGKEAVARHYLASSLSESVAFQ